MDQMPNPRQGQDVCNISNIAPTGFQFLGLGGGSGAWFACRAQSMSGTGTEPERNSGALET